VTIPPLQMSNNVATHVIHAKRLSHFVDLAEFPEFISEKDNRILRGFRRRVCSRRLVCDARPALFSHQHSASHSEEATAEDPAMLLAELACSLASAAHFPFSEHQLEVRPAIQLTRRAL